MTCERWVAIPGYEGLYEASDQGRVRSLDAWIVYADGHKQRRRGRVLKALRGPGGYPVVAISKEGKAIHRFVHHLVLETFVGPRPFNCETLYHDGDRSNAKLDNLRWGSRKENVKDAMRHGTRNRTKAKNAVLNEATVREIRAARGTKYQALLAEEFGISQSLVCRVQRNQRWSHVP